MGAEGVQMGTRMLSSAESPVHGNWKQAMLAAKENRYGIPEPAISAGFASPAYPGNRGVVAKGRVQCHGILRTRAGTLLWR